MKKVKYEFREPKTGGPGRKRVKRGEKDSRRMRVEKLKGAIEKEVPVTDCLRKEELLRLKTVWSA